MKLENLKNIRSTDIAARILIAIMAANMLTGCEASLTAGVHPVDNYESHSSYKNRGLKCLFTNCEEKEVQGS